MVSVLPQASDCPAVWPSTAQHVCVFVEKRGASSCEGASWGVQDSGGSGGALAAAVSACRHSAASAPLTLIRY
jgi:hypothetical protein